MGNDTFAVIEIQSNGGSLAVLSSTYQSWEDALSKFYSTMVAIVQSKVPEHTCMIIDKVGQVRKIETIYHGGAGDE